MGIHLTQVSPFKVRQGMMCIFLSDTLNVKSNSSVSLSIQSCRDWSYLSHILLMFACTSFPSSIALKFKK
ncbi:hypothetical protein BpHYR1_028782 [Brachionus plicatilis]|uniref:Uncharacterized protein n=1 Tax=Brachionus plicatilis TaxID=10195 RepID=A0A3M7RS98_BRAPC|nr:hypothetical protein BpHYR1_028782 [Brachionus plicatilis]